MAAYHPGAVQRELSAGRHFLYVAVALSRMEFKLRYFGSVLGYLWSFLRPFLLFGVLYLVFTKIVRAGAGVPHYPVLLLFGLVLFNFLADATMMGLPSLVARESLLRKVSFPRASIPIAVTATAAANLALGLGVVLVLALVNDVAVRASWFLIFPLFLAVFVFAAALALLLSVLFVRYRDVQPVWDVALQFVFWCTPIIYTIDFIPERFRQFVMLNPLAVAVEQGRHWLVGSEAPTAAAVMGSNAKLLLPAAVFAGVLVLSVWTFRRRSASIAEEL